MTRTRARLIWLPSAVTSIRTLAAVPLIFVVLADAWTAAFWIYIAALSTDFVDGLLARKLGAETKFGEVLDGWSDTALNGSVLLGLTLNGNSPWAIILAIIAGGVLFNFVQYQPKRVPNIAPYVLVGEVSCLFMTTIYLLWMLATLAYGWSWWFIPLTVTILVVLGVLKRRHIREWCAPFLTKRAAR